MVDDRAKVGGPAQRGPRVPGPRWEGHGGALYSQTVNFEVLFWLQSCSTNLRGTRQEQGSQLGGGLGLRDALEILNYSRRRAGRGKNGAVHSP